MGRRHGKKNHHQRTVRQPRSQSRWIFLLFLAGVFLVKSIVLAQLHHHPLLEPEGGVDSAAYVGLARRVLGGDLLLGPGLYYLSPLYVYFLAALLTLSDSFVFARVVQIALGTAAVACIFLTTRIWFGMRAAWFAAVLAAMTGVFTFYEIVIFQSSIDVFLSAAALLCLALALRQPAREPRLPGETPLPASLSGLLFGLEFLNRPNIAIAIAGVVLMSLVTRRWRTAAVLAAGFAVAVAPLAIRNAIVTHEFALTSSQGGLNFYIGNSATATGQYSAVAGVRATMAGQAQDTRTVAETAAGHPLTDRQISAHFTGLALNWMRSHPGDALALLFRKLALTFNSRHQWLDYSYPYYAHDTDSILGLLFVGPWLLVPLGFAGAAWLLTGSGSAGSTGSGFWVWSSFVPFYALSVALFFVAERYRLPLFVPLCVLSGGAIDVLLGARARIDRSSDIGYRAPATLAIALGISGAAVTAWPFQIDDGRYAERLRLSKVLMNERDDRDAAAELDRAFAIRPGDTATEFNLGMAEITGGQAAEGLSHVRHAVDAGVPIPGARYALVNAMLQTGDRAGAVTLLRTYAPAPEDTAESCYQVAIMALDAGAPRIAERYAQRALDLRPEWPAALELISRIPR